MHSFIETYQRVLEEHEEPCSSTFRTDAQGTRVEIPFGGSYRVGKNKRGVGVPKGWGFKEDKVGQIFAIPPGRTLKIGANGKGVVVCPNESTREKLGQIEILRSPIKMESNMPTCYELLMWGKSFDNR